MTTSYQKLAAELGKPHQARAVGRALGANPIPILIPCHRVVHENGSLGGYTGGLEWKRRLLAIEQGALRLNF
jgi:methylated-DNA-[protein]-cysteine S-methyltransferase